MSKVKLIRPLTLLKAAVILTLLPYTSTSTLPSSDPAPGRSPGPPLDVDVQTEDVKLTEETETVNPELETYDESTTGGEVVDMTTTEVNEVTSESEIVNACAYAHLASEDDVVTLSVSDSDVNLTLSHPVFEAEELVRGVVYEGEFYFVVDKDHNWFGNHARLSFVFG